MQKNSVVLVLVFALALGAGLAAGTLLSRLARTDASVSIARTPLGAELDLTPQQNAKMQSIWEQVRNDVDACFLRAQEAQRKRESALLALLSDEQKSMFAPVQQQYVDSVDAIKGERDAVFQNAVKQTEQILSDAQKTRYRQILHNRFGQGVVDQSPDWVLPRGSQP